ncbi:MAG TPA: hypothetical protein VFZ25_21200 [Chloroflexota bacterium]|nr:hypothetical protein [Chloroflexota bacterium]
MAQRHGRRGHPTEPVIVPKPAAQEPMVLSDREIWLIRSALQSYLTLLSHGEGDLEHELKDLIMKLQEWKCPGCSWSEVTLPQAKKVTM